MYVLNPRNIFNEFWTGYESLSPLKMPASNAFYILLYVCLLYIKSLLPAVIHNI